MSRKYVSGLMFIGVMILSCQLSAQCLTPLFPILPDGVLASEEQMLNAEHQVNEYLLEANGYLQCMEQREQLSVAGGSDTEAAKVQRDKDYEAMLQNIQLITEQLLMELKKFHRAE